MATAPVAFAESAPLASGDPRDDRAPAIAVGAPLAVCVSRSIAEENNRKRLILEDPNLVTTEELHQSRRRRVALETCEAQIHHGMGNGAILDAVQANAAAIQALAAAVQANGAAIQANGAAIRNMRRRELNRNGTWTRILVETVGPNAIGVAPATHPGSREDVLGMSGPQITALQAAFNLEPGRFDGANLAARRNAVLTYLLDG